MSFSCYTQTTLHRSQLLNFAVQKTQQPTINKNVITTIFHLNEEIKGPYDAGMDTLHSTAKNASLAAWFAFPWKLLSTAPRPGPSTR